MTTSVYYSVMKYLIKTEMIPSADGDVCQIMKLISVKYRLDLLIKLFLQIGGNPKGWPRGAMGPPDKLPLCNKLRSHKPHSHLFQSIHKYKT